MIKSINSRAIERAFVITMTLNGQKPPDETKVRTAKSRRVVSLRTAPIANDAVHVVYRILPG